MANRTSLCVFLSLSWLVCRPHALQLQAAWPNGAYISLAGHPRCGTSHLYNLLSSHRDVFSLRKGACPDNTSAGIDEGLFAQYLNFTVSRAQAEDGSWLRMEEEKVQEACANKFGAPDVCQTFYHGAKSGGSKNGTKVLQSCVHQPRVLARMQNLVPVPHARVLFLQRDPADMLWSAYNLLANRMDSSQTVATNRHAAWTNKLNYRSRRHFHEVVVSKGMLAGGVSDWADYMMIPHMNKLRAAFGEDQVLFLRSEDMHLRDTIQRICDFVGLDIDGIPPGLIDVGTNSRGSLDGRGVGNTSSGEQPGGRYEVSGFEPMYCKTRTLIYSQAKHVCTELDKGFGLLYPDCLRCINPKCSIRASASGTSRFCPDDGTEEAGMRHHGYWWHAAASERAEAADEYG